MDRPGEFDILHPLTSIQWREACRLPVKIQDLQSVLMGHNVIVRGGLTPGDSADATVYIYDINRDYWGIHSIAPTYLSALTTYRSQLVLAGGREVASGSVTNSVRVFENGEWCPSIPAMTVARYGASAVSRGQHLIVAGGVRDSTDYTISYTVGGYTDIVEVFDGRSWSTAQSLPQGCAYMKSVVYNDVWYVCGGERQGCEVYSAPLRSIVESTRDTQSTVWNKLPPTPHPFSSIAIFGQQLVTIGGGGMLSPTSAVHAFSPRSQPWPHVRDLPVALHSTCSLTLPNGELMTLGGGTDTCQLSDRVFLLREYKESLESLEESGEGGKAGQEKGSWEAEDSPEKICAPIRGADIVARTTVTLAAGEGYEWKGHGLRLTVPADALEPLSPPATVTIQASLSGHYHLPDHTQLVSGVYWISFPGKFSRPVTLEVQHCASLQPAHETSSLTFVTAKCSQETLPYNFKPMTGGAFSADSRFGTIELSHFSGFAVVKKKKRSQGKSDKGKGKDGGSGADGEAEGERFYTVLTYYIPQTSSTTWITHFPIIWDLDLFLQFVENRYAVKHRDAEEGPSVKVAISGPHIQFEIPKEGIKLSSGWSLEPLVSPVLTRGVVDSYKQGHKIPCFELELEWEGEERRAKKLSHMLHFTGVEPQGTFIRITRTAVRASPAKEQRPEAHRKRPGSQHGEVEGTTSKRQRQSADGDSAGPSTANTVPRQTETLAAATDGTTSGTKPTRNALDIDDLVDVKRELISIADKWKDIGLALRLKPATLNTIGRNQSDVRDRLSDVLAEWLNKAYNVQRFGQPSWLLLVRAVRDPAGGDNKALADIMTAKYGVR